MDRGRSAAWPGWTRRLCGGRRSGRLPLTGRWRGHRRRAVRLRRAISRRRCIRLSGGRRIGRARRRVALRRPISGWPGWRRAAREIRGNGGAEWVHPLGRAEARAIIGAEAARRSRREAPLIRLWGSPRPGRGGRRRAVVSRGRTRRLPGLRWRRSVLRRCLGRRRRRAPCRSRRRYRRLRRGSGRRAVGRRGSCRGQGVAAGQAKLAGRLIRSAAPRTRDHRKYSRARSLRRATRAALAREHTRFAPPLREDNRDFAGAGPPKGDEPMAARG